MRAAIALLCLLLLSCGGGSTMADQFERKLVGSIFVEKGHEQEVRDQDQ